MSKSLTVVCNGQEFKVEEVVGTIYVHRTRVILGSPILQLPETIVAVSPEEASYLAAAIRTIIGEDKPLEPKERIPEPSLAPVEVAPVVESLAEPVAAENSNKGEGADSVPSGVEVTPAELPESVR